MKRVIIEKRVILESPFSSGVRPPVAAVVLRNVRYLRACLRHSLLLGEAPYASHGLYTQEGVLDDDVPDERALGMAAGWLWLRVAHRSVAYVDLGWSRGMVQGVAQARENGIPVEERRLGGAWTECADPGACEGVRDATGLARGLNGSDGHVYWCPLWRAPERNGDR